MDFASPIRIVFRKEVTPANDDTGDWMALPATKEKLQQELARTDTDNRMASKIQPTDITSPYSWLSDAITDEADINELNYLAVKISELDGDGLDKLEAIFESGRHRGNNGIDHGEITDLINIVLNLDSFTFHPDFDAQNYGEYLLSGHGNVVDRMLRQFQNSPRLEDEEFGQYIEAMRESADAEVFGRSMSYNNDGEFLDIGYLIEDDGYREFYYSTDDIPNEYRILEPAEIITSTKHESIITVEYVYCSENNERLSENIGYPAEKDVIAQLLKNAGIDGVHERVFFIEKVDSIIPGLANALQDNIDINELNYLAVKIRDMSDIDRNSFVAALEARLHCSTVAEMINLTENIIHFELQPAFSPEQYGEFLIQMEQDNTNGVFNVLERSDNPDQRYLAKYITRLEEHIDKAAYGRAVSEEENGKFTSRGYITDRGNYVETYHGPQDIPHEYRVSEAFESERFVKTESSDLADLVYRIHALAGEYMPDARRNISTLANGVEHYLMLMGSTTIYLCETASAYRRDDTANDIWVNSSEAETDLRAFALHVTGCDECRIQGNLVEINLAEQREDILTHSIGFMNDINGLILHITELNARQAEAASIVSPETILGDMNQEFINKSSVTHSHILLVASGAAKELAVCGDAPVYRLLPGKYELLSPIDAMRLDNVSSNCQNHAVKVEDIDGFLKWAKRTANDIVCGVSSKDERDKPKSNGQEI